MAGEKCGGKTRAGGSCRRPAGWGTNHPGSGRCKLHAGSSTGAPKGNRNAVTTGGYESIFADQLTPEERELFASVDVSPKAQAEEEIRLLTIRERRMLARMREILDDPDAITPTSVVQTTGFMGSTQTASEHYIERVQRIEQALTRVQAQKTRAIEQYRRILADSTGETDDPLRSLADAIRSSRSQP